QPVLAHADEVIPRVEPVAVEGDPGPGQQRKNAPKPMELPVATFNAYQYPWMVNFIFGALTELGLKKDMYASPDPTVDLTPAGRVPKAIELLNKGKYGVVGLQEVNGPNGQAILDGIKKEYPYQTTRVGESCAHTTGSCSNSWLVVNGGAAIVSKYKIEERSDHVFNHYTVGSPEVLMNKGSQIVKISPDGQPLYVATLHTQSDWTFDNDLADPVGDRDQQFEEFRQHLANVVPKGSRVVVLMDGNIPDDGDEKSRLDMEQRMKKLGLDWVDTSKLPRTFDPETNPLVDKSERKTTLDVIAHSPGIDAENVNVVRPALQDLPSDHYLVEALLKSSRTWDPKDPNIKPGETANYNLNWTFLQRQAYFWSGFLKFYPAFAAKLTAKTLMGLAVDVSKFVADKVQGAGQIANDVTAFMADRIRDIAHVVSPVSKFVADRIQDSARLMQHVTKFVTDAVTHLARVVHDVIDSAYRGIFGGPETEKDKPATETKKELNGKEKAGQKDADKDESTSQTKKDSHIKNADNKKTHDKTDGDHNDTSATAHQKETQSTTDGSASVHADAEHRQADDKHLQQDTKAAQGVAGTATSSTAHTQDKETDLAAGHLATTAHENTQVKTPTASKATDQASSAAGTTAPDTSAGTEHPSKPTTKKTEQPHKTTNTPTTQDKTSTTNPKTNTTSPKTEKPDTQKTGTDHTGPSLKTTENSSAAGGSSASASTGRSSTKQPDTESPRPSATGPKIEKPGTKKSAADHAGPSLKTTENSSTAGTTSSNTGTGRSSTKQPSTTDHATGKSSASPSTHDTKTATKTDTTKNHDNTHSKSGK
ncbi:endonuclease/exonuclease/phosphatase family protein, partial [Mycobacteroides abscessus]|uniref:endonuclease/exonuclease/phosphatase family protein n=2 Tax=Mycobacteroides abscessus TaxID=36809 RepID=UPI00210794A2